MLRPNPAAVRAPYPAALAAIMNIARAHESRQWLAHWPQISGMATPLYDLPDLADQLHVARLSVKDESVRSPLGSARMVAALGQLRARHARSGACCGFLSTWPSA